MSAILPEKKTPKPKDDGVRRWGLCEVLYEINVLIKQLYRDPSPLWSCEDTVRKYQL